MPDNLPTQEASTPASPPAYAAPTKKKRGFRWFRWTLIGILLAIVSSYAWNSVIAPHLAEKAWREAGSPLPACGSKQVMQEIMKSREKMIAAAATNLPGKFELRRAKEVKHPESALMRLCDADYESSLGNGTLVYTVTWYDPEAPSLYGPDSLKVEIRDASVPDTIQQIPNLVKRMFNAIKEMLD